MTATSSCCNAPLRSEPLHPRDWETAYYVCSACGKPTLEVTPTFKVPGSDAPGSWPEDFANENGNYQNRCDICGSSFVGHKRRVMCKECAQAPSLQIPEMPTDPPSPNDEAFEDHLASKIGTDPDPPPSATPRTKKACRAVGRSGVDWHHSASLIMEHAEGLERELISEHEDKMTAIDDLNRRGDLLVTSRARIAELENQLQASLDGHSLTTKELDGLRVTWAATSHELAQQGPIQKELNKQLEAMEQTLHAANARELAYREALEDIRTDAHCIAKAGPSATKTLDEAWRKFDLLSVKATAALAKWREAAP